MSNQYKDIDEKQVAEARAGELVDAALCERGPDEAVKKAGSKVFEGEEDDVEDEVGSTNMPRGHGYPNLSRKDLEFDAATRGGDRLEYLIDGGAVEEATFPVHVTLYDVTRQLGGYEEGGWYYDAFEPLASVPVNSVEEIPAAAKKVWDEAGSSFDGKPGIYVEQEKHSQVGPAPHYESLAAKLVAAVLEEKTTFDEFVASGTDTDDLGSVFGEDYLDGEPGRVYLGRYYIQKIVDKSNSGKWLLVLANQEWVSDDLGELEEKLWDYASNELAAENEVKKYARFMRAVSDYRQNTR